jgi:creatinine amidohydrolase
MAVWFLDRMTWPDIAEQIKNGRDTVIVPFGSTEQHGRHLPIETDSAIGDALGRGLAEALGAFLSPTMRFGCSAHHLAFAGTISIAEDTFRKLVKDIVASLCRHGFRRIILLPTHGGNFTPLKEALAQLGPVEGVRIIGFTDLEGLLTAAFRSSAKFGVDPAKSGAHSGEWETSVMLHLKNEEVKMDQAAEGFLGSMAEIRGRIASGLENLDPNGVLGDPRMGTAAAGKVYVSDVVDFLHQWVTDQEAI